MLFGASGRVFAQYLPNPHSILEMRLSDPTRVVWRRSTPKVWDNSAYSSRWGELRGGCPPVEIDGIFYALGHSVFETAGGRTTVGAMYAYRAEAPFRVFAKPASPLRSRIRSERSTPFPKKTPRKKRRSILPVQYREGKWIISYGINNERCAIAIIPHEDLLSTLERLSFS